MNQQNVLKGLTTVMIISSLFAVTACADSTRGNGRSGRQQGPPAEAISACKDKKEGDTVTFTGPRGESLTGTCEMINNQLAAVPEGHNRRSR